MAATSITLPTWYRALAIVVGLVSIVLAFVVLADPALAVATLILLLGFALLVIGIDRLIAGVTGHPYGGFFVAPAREIAQEASGTPIAGGNSGTPPKP